MNAQDLLRFIVETLYKYLIMKYPGLKIGFKSSYSIDKICLNKKEIIDNNEFENPVFDQVILPLIQKYQLLANKELLVFYDLKFSELLEEDEDIIFILE